MSSSSNKHLFQVICFLYLTLSGCVVASPAFICANETKCAPANETCLSARRFETLIQTTHNLGSVIVKHKLYNREFKIPLEYHYTHVSRWIAFSYSFGDAATLIRDFYDGIIRNNDYHTLPGYNRFGREKMKLLVNKLVIHARGDIGHGDYAVEDYGKRFDVDQIPLKQFRELIYGEAGLFLRKYKYLVFSLIMQQLPNPLHLAHTIEVMEEFAGFYFLVYISQTVKMYGRFVGKQFNYFGGAHEAREKDHEGFHDVLAGFHLTEEDAYQINDTIYKHYRNHQILLQDSLEFMLKFETQVLGFIPNPAELVFQNITRIF